MGDRLLTDKLSRSIITCKHIEIALCLCVSVLA